MLAEAREEAERLVAEARAEAEQTVARARHEAERAIAEGRRQYTELTDRAQAEADRIGHGRPRRARPLRRRRAGRAGTAWSAQTEVVRAAHAEAARIVDAADAEADRLRRECDGYVDAKLAEFEDTLAKALRTVSRGRTQLWGGGPAAPVGVGPNGRSGTGMDLID